VFRPSVVFLNLIITFCPLSSFFLVLGLGFIAFGSPSLFWVCLWMGRLVEEKWRGYRYYVSEGLYLQFKRLCEAHGGTVYTLEPGGRLSGVEFEAIRSVVLESELERGVREAVRRVEEKTGVDVTKLPDVEEYERMGFSERMNVCRDALKVAFGVDIDPRDILRRGREAVKGNDILEKAFDSAYVVAVEEVANLRGVSRVEAESEYRDEVLSRAVSRLCEVVLIHALRSAGVSGARAVAPPPEEAVKSAPGEFVEIAYGIFKATGGVGIYAYRLPLGCGNVRDSFEVVASGLEARRFLFPYEFEGVEKGSWKWSLEHLVDPDALARGDTSMRFYRFNVSYEYPFSFASYLPPDDEFVRRFRLYARYSEPKLYSELLARSPPVERLKGEALRVFVSNLEREFRSALSVVLPPPFSGRVADILRPIPLGLVDRVSDLLAKYAKDYKKTLGEVGEEARRELEEIGRILAIEVGRVVGMTEEELARYFAQAGFIGFNVISFPLGTLQPMCRPEVKVEVVTDQLSPVNVYDPMGWRSVSYLRFRFTACSPSLDTLVRAYRVFKTLTKPPYVDCFVEFVMERKGFFRFTPKCGYLMRKRGAITDFVREAVGRTAEFRGIS